MVIAVAIMVKEIMTMGEVLIMMKREQNVSTVGVAENAIITFTIQAINTTVKEAVIVQLVEGMDTMTE